MFGSGAELRIMNQSGAECLEAMRCAAEDNVREGTESWEAEQRIMKRSVAEFLEAELRAAEDREMERSKVFGSRAEQSGG